VKGIQPFELRDTSVKVAGYHCRRSCV